MESFFHWLNRPYPLISGARDKTILVLAFPVFVYLFLLLYQPFGAAEIKEGKKLFLLGFSFNVFISLAFNYFLLPILFKRLFQAESWQIKKEIVYVSWSFFLIAVLNYFYNSSIGADIAPQHNLLGFIGITFSVGIFPLIGLILITESYLNKKNKQTAQGLGQQRAVKQRASPFQTPIKIQADTLKSPDLELNLDNFLFATSDNNYTTFFYLKNGSLEKQLLRLSLKKVEQQLIEYEDIIRCHRSYMINKLKIQKISGNARSLTIQLEHYDELIPVSRGFPKEKLL